ncbi:MAG: glutamyl-tRNA reductase [Nitrososphaerales archaeon]
MEVSLAAGTEEIVSAQRPHGVAPLTSIVLIGTSFKTSSIAYRERALKSFQAGSRRAIRRAARHTLESCLLVTCNRIELYVATDDPVWVAESVLSGMPKPEAGPGSFYVKSDLEAVSHIFEVASGLDSLVLGEDQILQQIREAGAKARASGNAGSILSSLFVAAYNVGKRVRTSLEVAQANTSVSAFALEFALEKLGRRPKKILLIGTGKTARLAATKLKGTKIYIASRRKDARDFFPTATVVTYKQLKSLAWDGDLVISATRHAGYVIKRGDLPDERKLVLLDLAFPRNIDPALKNSGAIELYDLDDLAVRAKSVPRAPAFAAGEKMVREEAERFTSRIVASRLSPILAIIYRWAEDIRSSEADVALRMLPNLSESERKVLEAMSKSIVGKLLAPHTAFAKQPGGEISQAERLRMLETLFCPEASK